jgi:hypothetical protein
MGTNIIGRLKQVNCRNQAIELIDGDCERNVDRDQLTLSGLLSQYPLDIAGASSDSKL